MAMVVGFRGGDARWCHLKHDRLNGLLSREDLTFAATTDTSEKVWAPRNRVHIVFGNTPDWKDTITIPKMSFGNSYNGGRTRMVREV